MKFFNTNEIEKSWLFFSLIFITFASLSLWPFIANDYPGLSDYANHLARLHLLTGHAAEGWQKYYAIDDALIPNLALDVIASAFVKMGLSPEVALRIFSGLTNLFLVAGVAFLSSAVNKRPPWIALLAFPLAFNRYFIWGFLNYYFSVALCLLLFAFWIFSRKFEKNNRLMTAFATSFFLIAILLSHLMGYAIAMLCISIYELRNSFLESDWRSRFNKISRLSLIFLPSLVVYLFLCEHSTTQYPVVYQEIIKSKISGLLSPFAAYNLKIIPVQIIGLMLVSWLALSAKSRTIKESFIKAFPNYIYLVPLALFLVFLVAPSAMMNSYFLDKRLLEPVLFLVLGLMIFQTNTTRVLQMILIALTMHLVRVNEVNQVWGEQTKAMHQIISALDEIKMGSKIEGFNFTDDKLMPVPPLQHALSAAIYTRASYVPTIFAKPVNAESIKMNAPYDDLGHSAGTYKYTYVESQMHDVCNAHYVYDYVIVTYITILPKMPECLNPIKKGDHFVLYEVIN